MSSTRRNKRILRNLVLAGATALLSGAALAGPVESSCPDPCTIPPKSALFFRQPHGVLQVNGDIVPLEGTMRAGVKKTVLRVDAGVTIVATSNVPGVYVGTSINGVFSSPNGLYQFPCQAPAYCSATGTFWFDIDALEAAYPGTFVGQPLTIKLHGGNSTGGGGGLNYEASFSAEVVKKK